MFFPHLHSLSLLLFFSAIFSLFLWFRSDALSLLWGRWPVVSWRRSPCARGSCCSDWTPTSKACVRAPPTPSTSTWALALEPPARAPTVGHETTHALQVSPEIWLMLRFGRYNHHQCQNSCSCSCQGQGLFIEDHYQDQRLMVVLAFEAVIAHINQCLFD